MENNFFQWKADPYFSIAEDIQSSADRLESIFRIWQRINETSLNSYPQAYSNYQIELNAACDTLSWQVEEFEKEVCDSKPDKLNKNNDLRRRLNFIHSIRFQVNDIKKKVTESCSNSFLPIETLSSNLSNFLNGFVSESNSSFESNHNSSNSISCNEDIRSFSQNQSDDLEYSSVHSSTSKQSSLNSLPSDPFIPSNSTNSTNSSNSSNFEFVDDDHPSQIISFLTVHEESMIESINENKNEKLDEKEAENKSENSLIVHSSSSDDNSNHHSAFVSIPHSNQSQSSVHEEQCENKVELLHCNEEEERGTIRQPQLWELFLPKLKQNKVMKRRNGHGLIESRENSDDVIMDMGKFENVQNEEGEESKGLLKIHSRYLQWITKPQLRLTCFRPLQIAACVFLICSITGFSHLYMKKSHFEGFSS